MPANACDCHHHIYGSQYKVDPRSTLRPADATVDDYRAWKRAHVRSDAFPGGESLDDAARRYAGAFERLLQRPESNILIVTHEIPLRYAINAADNSDELDGPAHQLANATPYLFDEEALGRAVAQIRRVAVDTSQRCGRQDSNL